MFSEFIISGIAYYIDSSNAEDGVASTKSLPVITTSLSIDASSDTNNDISLQHLQKMLLRQHAPLLEVLMYIKVIPSIYTI